MSEIAIGAVGRNVEAALITGGSTLTIELPLSVAETALAQLALAVAQARAWQSPRTLDDVTDA